MSLRRKEPPTLEEVKLCQWWWSIPEDTHPHILHLDTNGDKIMNIEPYEYNPFRPEDWPGEWAPCILPE